MAFENAQTIPELNSGYPLGSDPVAQGDDHIRSIKTALLAYYTANYRELVRRAYLDIGCNLVEGDFKVGGTLSDANDIMLYGTTGKVFSWNGPYPHTVDPDTFPGAGYTDRSNESIKAGLDATNASIEVLKSDLSKYEFQDINQRLGNGVLIFAHRNGGVGTENSIMNYQKMMETGCYDGIELDMAISGDGVLYNFHDVDVSILTNGTGNFNELPSSYIDTLRYKYTEGTSIAGERIPRLYEVLRVAADFDCWVNAEIKVVRADAGVSRLSDVNLMIDELKAAGVFEKTVLGAFAISLLQAAIDYDEFSSVIRYVYPYTTAGVDEVAALTNKGLKIASIETASFNKSVADYIKSKNVIPAVWTPNDSAQQEAAIGYGARVINSDAWGLGNLGGKQ